MECFNTINCYTRLNRLRMYGIQLQQQLRNTHRKTKHTTRKKNGYLNYALHSHTNGYIWIDTHFLRMQVLKRMQKLPIKLNGKQQQRLQIQLHNNWHKQHTREGGGRQKMFAQRHRSTTLEAEFM